MTNQKLSPLSDYLIDQVWNNGQIRGFHIVLGKEFQLGKIKQKFTEETYTELLDNQEKDDRLYKVSRIVNTICIEGRRRKIGQDNEIEN